MLLELLVVVVVVAAAAVAAAAALPAAVPVDFLIARYPAVIAPTLPAPPTPRLLPIQLLVFFFLSQNKSLPILAHRLVVPLVVVVVTCRGDDDVVVALRFQQHVLILQLKLGVVQLFDLTLRPFNSS